MADLTDLQNRRERLLRARAAGVRRITADGRTIEYRDDAELARAIAHLDQQISIAEGKTAAGRIRTVVGKGL